MAPQGESSPAGMPAPSFCHRLSTGIQGCCRRPASRRAGQRGPWSQSTLSANWVGVHAEESWGSLSPAVGAEVIEIPGQGASQLGRGSTLTETAHPGQALKLLFALVVLGQEVLVRNRKLIGHHQLGEFGKGQKVTPPCPTTSQNPSHWHPSWLNKACATRKDPESEQLAKDNPETNPITIKPETASTKAVQSILASLTRLLSAQVPLPNKVSCFVSRNVSLDNSFPSVTQEPTFGPWKGFPFLQQITTLEGTLLCCD